MIPPVRAFLFLSFCVLTRSASVDGFRATPSGPPILPQDSEPLASDIPRPRERGIRRRAPSLDPPREYLLVRVFCSSGRLVFPDPLPAIALFCLFVSWDPVYGGAQRAVVRILSGPPNPVRVVFTLD